MWKDIPDWETQYEVNEYGEVRNKRTMKCIIGDINSAGYQRVRLYDKPRTKMYFRHRLVAILFLPNPNHFAEVNHKDGNKQNNHVSNLEWCSRKHNEREARRVGVKEYKPFYVKYKNGEIKNYEFASQLSDELGVTKGCVLQYLHGISFGYKNRGISEIQYLQKA